MGHDDVECNKRSEELGLPVGPGVKHTDKMVAHTDERCEDGEIAKSNAEPTPEAPPYSVFGENTKRYILILCSLSGLISSFSASIYLPALTDLASDLHVSGTSINLTITTYLILQGIAPSFVGTFSDIYGRRPAYIFCFVLYIGANVGLALQSSYPALLVLRALQSAGSSSTVAIGSAVVADVSTRAERGKWMAWAMIGMVVGPTLGPVIGGLLVTFLGWRAIFWFLTIFSSVMGFLILVTLPETCRAVVGDGSIPAGKWNTSLLDLLRNRDTSNAEQTDNICPSKSEMHSRRFNPLDVFQILLGKEGASILIYGALQFSGYFLVLSTLSEELTRKYNFDALQTGLCYLPMGVGSILSRFTITVLVDRNYRRLATNMGIVVQKNRQERQIEDFPIERARLQVGIPMIYLAALFIIIYGWVMQFRTTVAGPLICLFLVGLTSTGAFTILGTLVVDTNLERSATAVAGINLARCLTGAAFTAFALPLINAIDIGWTGTLVAFVWFLASPLLWLVMIRGPQWRKARAERLAQQRQVVKDGTSAK